jgi:hypothetical protein|tara:strand:+ start:1041 stop:1988 length:948 start_codon:yes stop_codon:yes gene_type:complete
MDKKIGILFTARNNYKLLDSWMNMVDIEGLEVLSIDEDSDKNNKEQGKQICEKHNVVYMDREERGMQNNIVTACNYYKPKGIEWIIWFQHDCFPFTNNFFTELNKTLSSGKCNKFGVLGFNAHQAKASMYQLERGNQELDVTGRAPLEPGDYWYRNKKYWGKSRPDYSNPEFKKPFAVESVAWYSAMVNIDMYLEHIIPTDDYHFFHAWDDIAFQFLYRNIYNVCLPSFDIKHDKDHKVALGFPVSSPHGNAEQNSLRDHLYGKWGHLEVWKERWGWDYNARDEFGRVEEQYKDTLLSKFYNHDPANGPLKSFDL